MDPVTAQLISNTQMPATLAPDLFESFNSKIAESQQQVVTEEFDSIADADQMGVNKPTAPEGGDGDTSLVSKFFETSDNKLKTAMDDVHDFQGRVLKGEMSMTQKVDTGIKIIEEIAEAGLQLQGGRTIGKSTEDSVTTMIRTQ